MLASHVKLSSEGQIIIPKKKQQGIHALRGMLQDKNLCLSTEELCQPVDVK